MTVIPFEIILQAFKNSSPTEDQQRFGSEIRRLMRAQMPDVEVTTEDIRAALVYALMVAEQEKNREEREATNLVAASINPNGITVGELEKRVAQCSGFVKLMTGVANNAALSVMYYCLDKIADVRPKESYIEKPRSPHPKYKQKVKQLFNRVLEERDRYRSALKNPRQDQIRFFTVSDIQTTARKRFGEGLTDAQYFEFWEGTGALAYQKSQPLIGSLWNKFRLSMNNHGVKHADIVAWGLVAAAVLELSVTIWERAMRSVHEACDGMLTTEYIREIYKPFSMVRISAAWQRALAQMAPETKEYKLDDTEERNVAIGVEQLMELWVSADLPFDSTIRAVEDFQEDIFSTKGYAKKTIRELSEMRNEAIQEMEKTNG